MRNDQQSIEEKPVIIHGANLAFEKNMINYHKKIPVLVPFNFYGKNKSVDWKPWWSYLFMDSGAFSVSTNNAEVFLHDYIEFLFVNQDKIGHYAALDDIFSWEKSLENWRLMRKEGLFPIPVYHEGEPIKVLEEYVEDCTYIGLGNVSNANSKSRMVFFDKVFSMYPDRSKIGFHGFGVTSPSFLRRYPWKSVDSTTISTICRNGAVFLYDHLYTSVSISEKSRGDFIGRWKSELKEIEVKKIFDSFGRDYEKAKKSTKEGLLERMFFSLDYLEKYIIITDKFNPKIKLSSLLI